MEELNMRMILFYVFSFIMVASALGVVLHRNPVKSAMFLVSFFVGLAAMYALLGAEFLAVVQILVYVGAIMVLFLFVIMLISVREENFESPGSNLGRTAATVLLIGAFAVQFLVMARVFTAGPGINASRPYHGSLGQTGKIIEGNVELLSFKLFQGYLLPFELISIVLLVAAIGAVVLAKKNRRKLQ